MHYFLRGLGWNRGYSANLVMQKTVSGCASKNVASFQLHRFTSQCDWCSIEFIELKLQCSDIERFHILGTFQRRPITSNPCIEACQPIYSQLLYIDNPDNLSWPTLNNTKLFRDHTVSSLSYYYSYRSHTTKLTRSLYQFISLTMCKWTHIRVGV